MLEVAQLLIPEPECDFVLSRLYRVRAMEAIFLLAQTVVASECADCRLGRVCSTNHLACRSDDIITLPNHGYDWPCADPSDQSPEEGFALVLLVMLLKMSLVRSAHLHGHKFEAAGLQSQDQLVDEASLDSIGL